MKTKSNNNIESIQILRALASVLVLLAHISVKASQYHVNILKGWDIAGCGVEMFFFISGFIMCMSTYNKSISSFSFIKKRILRIMPMYWLVTILALIVYLYNPALVNSSGGQTNIVSSFFLLPTNGKYLNENGWTLSFEFFFYIIFCLFINNDIRKTVWYSSLVICMLVIIGAFVKPKSSELIFITNPILIEFVMGMCAFIFFISYKRKFSTVFSYFMMAIGILLFVIQLKYHIPEYVKYRVITLGIPMFLIFVGFYSIESVIKKSDFLGIKKIFLALGDSSYSLYLIHPFTLSGGARLLKMLGYQHYSFLFVSFLLIVSLSVGHLVYALVEVNMNRFFIKK